MKPRLLDLLVCPACKGELSLRTDQASGDDVMSGTPNCGGCRAGYLGVLHHTPDTAAAFERVAAMVRKGGYLAVYGYHYHAGGLARYVSDTFRAFATRVPRRVVYYASMVSVPLYFLHRAPLIGRASQGSLPTSAHPDWRWRWLDTFDWHGPRYQWKHRYPEVLRWFREAGFGDLYVADEPICVRGLKVSVP
jgi:hypothetical protein